MESSDYEWDTDELIWEPLYSVIIISTIFWQFHLYLLTFFYIFTVAFMIIGTEESEELNDFRYASWAEEEEEDFIENMAFIWNDQDEIYIRTLWEFRGIDFMPMDLINLMEVRSVTDDETEIWIGLQEYDKIWLDEFKYSFSKYLRSRTDLFPILEEYIYLFGIDKDVNLEGTFFDKERKLAIDKERELHTNKIKSEAMNTAHLVEKRKLLEYAFSVAKEKDIELWNKSDIKAVSLARAYKDHADKLRYTWISSGLYTATDLDYEIFLEVLEDFDSYAIRNKLELNKLHLDYTDIGYIKHFKKWANLRTRARYTSYKFTCDELDNYIDYRLKLAQDIVQYKIKLGLWSPIDVSHWWDSELSKLLFVDDIQHQSSNLYMLQKSLKNLQKSSLAPKFE